jgi:hypothetical protein
MQDVYETLLGHMKDHVILGQYLQFDVPDFENIWTDALPYLSSGEKIMVQVALALYNGHTTATIADIFNVDDDNRWRILNALTLRINGDA